MDVNVVNSILDSLFLAFTSGFERFEEPGMISEDFSQVRFGWGNWLEQPDPVILKNSNTWLSSDNYTVDFVNGVVSLNKPLVSGDEIKATYTMRLFSQDLYAPLIIMTMSEINIKKPQTNFTVQDAPDNYIGTLTLGVLIKVYNALLLKLGMFKWRRLFEDPVSIETQLRANAAEARAQYEAELLTIKRRGLIQPSAVASFNVGRQGCWSVNEINFQQFIVAR